MSASSFCLETWGSDFFLANTNATILLSFRQHRPYPKEGAWHRLRHFTLAALRYPSDAMNLNYNPGFPVYVAP